MADRPTTDELLHTDFVRDHLARAMEYGTNAYQESIREAWGYQLNAFKFDSPLEMAFLAWWLVMTDRPEYGGSVTLRVQPTVELSEGQVFRPDFEVVSFGPSETWMQTTAARFRVEVPRIAVELDGHDFHERTKEQVTYRNQRDRALQAAHWRVLHFSGSEFHKNPLACVQSTYDVGYQTFLDFQSHLHHSEWEAKTPEEKDFEHAKIAAILDKPTA